MRAGNASYLSDTDIPDTVPVFALSGALLLPGGHLPLNIFEPRYLSMVEDAIVGNRLIAMVQPADFGETHGSSEEPELCEVGCLGRIIAHQESGDGKLVISLSGICRIRLKTEVGKKNGYRNFQIQPFVGELENPDNGSDVDRKVLRAVFKRYLDANGMDADWESIDKTDNETLVTALCMMSPYGPAEKQALLEAPDLKARTDTLVALTEITLAKTADGEDTLLQ